MGGGGNHLTPPTYQKTVPIANALTARTPLAKIQGVFEQLHIFLLQQLSLCCCLKPPYYNTCADSKGGGGGEFSRLPPPCMNPCLHAAPPHLRSSWHAWAASCVVQSTSHPPVSFLFHPQSLGDGSSGAATIICH